MDRRAGKWGCAILVILLLILGAIYFYAFRETEQTTPSPALATTPPVG